MYPPRAAGLALALLMCLGATALPAQDEDDDFRALTAPDQARIEQLLQGFDPASFELRTEVMNPDGSVQARTVGTARGLTSLEQLETERAGAVGAAGTNHTINIFSQAKTNHTINVFREAASTNTNLPLFADAGQQQSAMEINSILQKYVSAPAGAPPAGAAPAEVTPQLREGSTLTREPVSGQLAPLSARDQAQVEQLLQAFDPNSYELRTQVASDGGGVQSRTLGQDKGLASLEQLETQRAGVRGEGPPSVHSTFAPGKTNHTINIFSQAKTNHTINVFREALGATTTTINIFKDATQQQNAMEINAILQRYLTGP